jgi:hypothetical protein
MGQKYGFKEEIIPTKLQKLPKFDLGQEASNLERTTASKKLKSRNLHEIGSNGLDIDSGRAHRKVMKFLKGF